MNVMKRLFLAVDLSDELKTEIEDKLLPLRQDYPDFRWIPKRNYHITLHFYGQIKNIKRIIEELTKKTYDKKSFYLQGQTLNLFVSKKITLFLDFKKERRLLDIQKELDEKKNFYPHLTIARYRLPSKQQYFVLKKRLLKTSIKIFFKVKELVLFESIANGQFPFYKPLAKFPLIEF